MTPLPHHLEDYAVGQGFETDPLTVTEEDIIAFAKSFDPQPFHTSRDTAEGTFFGELVASGWHTAALTMRLLVSSGPGPEWGFIGRAIDKMEWPRPVRPGDQLRLKVEVTAVKPSRSRPELGMVQTQWTTLNQHDQPVQKCICTMPVPRRTVARAAAE